MKSEPAVSHIVSVIAKKLEKYFIDRINTFTENLLNNGSFTSFITNEGIRNPCSVAVWLNF